MIDLTKNQDLVNNSRGYREMEPKALLIKGHLAHSPLFGWFFDYHLSFSYNITLLFTG